MGYNSIYAQSNNTRIRQHIDFLKYGSRRDCPFYAERIRLEIISRRETPLAQGADFCGMSIYDFISNVSHAGIPIIDYSIEDVDRELAQLHDNR